MKSRWKFFSLAVVFLSAGFPATTPEQPVQISVEVTDRKGNFIQGLRPDEFEIVENGKRQEIKDFASGQVRNGQLFVTTADGATSSRSRVFFVIVDQASANFFSLQKIKNPLKDFLKKLFNRGDSICLFMGREAVAWLQGRLVDLSPKTETQETGATRKLALAEIFSDFSEQVVDSTQTPYTPAGLQETRDKGFNPKEKPQERFAGLDLDYSRFGMLNFVGRLNSLARMVEAIPGEKTLLIISEDNRDSGESSAPDERKVATSYIGGGRFMGIVVDDGEKVAPRLVSSLNLGETLSHSRTAVYSVLLDSGLVRMPHLESTEAIPSSVLFSSGKDKSQPTGLAEIRVRSESEVYRNMISDLAKETGGIVLPRTKNIEDGLAKIGQAMEEMYLVSYVSTNPRLDGKFRKVEVKVKREGVIVRHRKGYFAVDRDAEAEKELRRSLEQKVSSPTLTVILKTETLPLRPSGLFFLLKTELKGLALTDRLKIEESGAQSVLSSRFRLLLQVENEKGEVIKREVRPFNLEVRQNELHLRPAIYGGEMLGEGKYRVRLALKDEVGGEVTTVEKEVEVRVPERGPKQNRLDRVCFVRKNFPVFELGDIPRFMEYEGALLYPRLDSEFGTEEAIDLFVEMSSDNPGRADFYLTVIRIKDEQVFKSYEMSAFLERGSNPIMMSVPLKDFFFGDYILQVLAIERENGQYSLVRLPFQVVP